MNLRPMPELESKFYDEAIDKINTMLAQEEINLDSPPSKRLAHLTKKTSDLFDRISYIPTAVGVMMRQEPDRVAGPITVGVMAQHVDSSGGASA